VSFISPFRAYAVAGLAALAVLLAVPLSAHASQDMFLQMGRPDLQGETLDKSMPGAISISEFSWKIENPVNIGSASGGAGSGKASLEPLVIKKAVDASSPGLMMAAAKGITIPYAALVIRKADARQPDAYLQYRFRTVFVTDVETSADGGGDGVSETVTLKYGSVQQRYLPTKPGAVNPIITGWDQVANGPFNGDWTANPNG
jgi:type VI secretion system secreted protein Hcp